MTALLALAVAASLVAQPAPESSQLTASAMGRAILIDDAVMGRCASVSLPATLADVTKTADSANWRAQMIVGGKRVGVTVTCEPAAVEVKLSSDARVPIAATAALDWGEDPYPARLNPAGEDDGVLQVELGGASTGLCDALYDRYHDRALQVRPGGLRAGGANSAYALDLAATVPAGGELSLLRLDVVPNFYRDKRGITYFAPIDKTVFKHAQAGWCSWYYYYRNVHDNDVVDNAKWLAVNLRKYGVKWIQIDDGWQAHGQAQSGVWRDWRSFDPDFPHGMKWLGDQIKAAGFEPGLWLTPYGTNAEDLVKAHPDWFIKDGPNNFFDSGWIGRYFIDSSNPQVQADYVAPLFERMTRDWGFDYFKIDGQPSVINMYRQQKSHFGTKMSPADAYRATLKTIRDVLGPNRYLLGCWGTPIEGIGYMNGSRTGGDVSASWGGMMPALDATRSWYFLNNLCWYCDPDCLLVRDPLTLGQAEVWASLYGLTGQHLMLSDNMPALPEARVEVLKRVLPVADLRPMDLYRRSELDTVAVRLRKAGAEWSVVGLFNWTRRTERRTVDFAALGLPASPRDRYIVWDFWGKGCLGVASGSLPVTLAPESCLVLGLRAWDGKPALVGIDRHVTQGGVSLASLGASDTAHGRTVAGSSVLVPDEPYLMTFAVPTGWKVGGVSAKAGTLTQERGGLLWLTLSDARAATVDWEVSFQRTAAPAGGAGGAGGAAADPPPAALTGLKAKAGRHNVTLTWDPVAGACYYTVACDGKQVARTTKTTAWDLLPAGKHSYVVDARSLPGRVLARSAAVEAEAPPTITPPKPEVYLSDLKPVSAKQGWGTLHMDKSVGGHQLTIDGRKFTKGLGTHAASDIVYDLGGKSGELVGYCGVDSETGYGSVDFKIVVDGKTLWKSPLMEQGDAPEGFVVPFADAHRLELVVDDGGDGINYDHADWADIGFLWKR